MIDVHTNNIIRTNLVTNPTMHFAILEKNLILIKGTITNYFFTYYYILFYNDKSRLRFSLSSGIIGTYIRAESEST